MSQNHIFFSLIPDSRLAKEVVSYLGFDLSPIEVNHFADGETFVRPLSSVRNKKVFIIHSLSNPVNENLMTLLIAIDAFKRAAPSEINLILPYYCYSRQDRKSRGREPITAKLVADFLTVAGSTRALLVDIHSKQIQGFFNIPTDHVTTIYPIAEYMSKNLNLKSLKVVSPDFGGIGRARDLSNLLGVGLVIIDKQRLKPNESISSYLLGDVEGKDCLIIDDILDTGGTIIGGAKILKDNGAKSVMVVITHGLFSGNSFSKLESAWKEGLISKVFVTNTIEGSEKPEFVEVISISELLSKVIETYVCNKGSLEQIYGSYVERIKAQISCK